MRIGARAQHLWKAEWAKSERAALAETNSLVRAQWKKAQGLSITERAAWLAGELKVIDSSGEPLSFEEYQEDVRGALQQQQGINLAEDDSDPARIITITPKRPWRKRNGIYRQVAREFRKYGVSPESVRKYHNRFLRLEKAITN